MSALCLGKVTGTGFSANITGSFSQSERKVYRACIQSLLGYASETSAMKVEDMARLERMERMMVRWMCGVHLKSNI